MNNSEAKIFLCCCLFLKIGMVLIERNETNHQLRNVVAIAYLYFLCSLAGN